MARSGFPALTGSYRDLVTSRRTAANLYGRRYGGHPIRQPWLYEGIIPALRTHNSQPLNHGVEISRVNHG